MEEKLQNLKISQKEHNNDIPEIELKTVTQRIFQGANAPIAKMEGIKFSFFRFFTTRDGKESASYEAVQSWSSPSKTPAETKMERFPGAKNEIALCSQLVSRSSLPAIAGWKAEGRNGGQCGDYLPFSWNISPNGDVSIESKVVKLQYHDPFLKEEKKDQPATKETLENLLNQMKILCQESNQCILVRKNADDAGISNLRIEWTDDIEHPVMFSKIPLENDDGPEVVLSYRWRSHFENASTRNELCQLLGFHPDHLDNVNVDRFDLNQKSHAIIEEVTKFWEHYRQKQMIILEVLITILSGIRILEEMCKLEIMSHGVWQILGYHIGMWVIEQAETINEYAERAWTTAERFLASTTKLGQRHDHLSLLASSIMDEMVHRLYNRWCVGQPAPESAGDLMLKVLSSVRNAIRIDEAKANPVQWWIGKIKNGEVECTMPHDRWAIGCLLAGHPYAKEEAARNWTKIASKEDNYAIIHGGALSGSAIFDDYLIHDSSSGKKAKFQVWNGIKEDYLPSKKSIECLVELSREGHMEFTLALIHLLDTEKQEILPILSEIKEKIDNHWEQKIPDEEFLRFLLDLRSRIEGRMTNHFAKNKTCPRCLGIIELKEKPAYFGSVQHLANIASSIHKIDATAAMKVYRVAQLFGWLSQNSSEEESNLLLWWICQLVGIDVLETIPNSKSNAPSQVYVAALSNDLVCFAAQVHVKPNIATKMEKEFK